MAQLYDKLISAVIHCGLWVDLHINSYLKWCDAAVSGCALQSYESQVSCWAPEQNRTYLRPADSSCQALWRAPSMNKSQIMTWFLAGHEVCCHTSPVIERQSAPVRNRKTSLPPASSNFCCFYWHWGARLRFAQSWDLNYVSLTFQNECFSIASVLSWHCISVKVQMLEVFLNGYVWNGILTYCLTNIVQYTTNIFYL